MPDDILDEFEDLTEDEEIIILIDDDDDYW